MAQGVCLFCLNFICFYTASQWIPSGLVAVVFSTATPVECAERPPVVRPAHRVERDGRWRSRPARPGAAVLAGTGGSPGHPGNLLRPRPGPARHAVLLHRQHAFQPATEGRHPPAHRQCLEHALRHPDPPGAVPVPGRAAEFRLERALRRLAAVPGDPRLGDRLHRLPDPGRAHGPGSRRLLHRAVPGGGAEHLGLRRGLPLDRTGAGRAGPGDARQRLGVPQAEGAGAGRAGARWRRGRRAQPRRHTPWIDQVQRPLAAQGRLEVCSARSAMARRVSWVAEPMCGRVTTLSRANSGDSASGSFS